MKCPNCEEEITYLRYEIGAYDIGYFSFDKETKEYEHHSKEINWDSDRDKNYYYCPKCDSEIIFLDNEEDATKFLQGVLQ